MRAALGDMTTTVPVRKEKATLETDPITTPTSTARLRAETFRRRARVVLSEEEVVVDKQVVPKERVRPGTETVSTDQELTEELRKERSDADGDVERR